MSVFLQFDFPYDGAWGDELTTAMDGLARSITNEPGHIWTIWTANDPNKEASGTYPFSDEANAKKYLDMHTARLKNFGISFENGTIFFVNEGLSLLDRGPIQKSGKLT